MDSRTKVNRPGSHSALVDMLAAQLPSGKGAFPEGRGQSPLITPLLSHMEKTATVEAPNHATGARGGFVEYLNKVSANPNDPLRTDLIKQYFVFPARRHIGTPGLPVINRSATHLRKSVLAWQARARALADAFKHSHTTPRQERRDSPRLAILEGERGVGKTFLQNYVISQYAQAFDEAKVLWVRISLVRHFDEECSLDYWIKAQIAKVLCRYYDPASRVYPMMPRPGRFVIDADAVLQEAGAFTDPGDAMKIRAMLRILQMHQPTADRDLLPEWIPSIAVDVLFDAAVHAGLGFIVVLDGLDLLGHTRDFETSFERTLASLARYLMSEAPLWRYHLLFIRRESRGAIDEKVLTPIRATPEHYRNTDHGVIAGVPLSTLCAKRLDVLASRTVAERIGGYRPEEVTEFRQFLEATPSGLDRNGTPVSYDVALKSVLGTNARGAMQVLHAAAHEYARGISGKHYLLTDRLMRLGTPLPPAAPTYRTIHSEGGLHLEREAGTLRHTAYEATFLPAIFRFPYARGALAMGELWGESRAQVLMGLRILQIAAVLRRNQSDTETPTQTSLTDYVSQLFFYEPIYVRALVDEFIDEEVLVVIPAPEQCQATDLPSRPLELSPKGRKILTTYIADPTYLNLSSFNMPVPRALLSSRRKPPFIHVVPLNDDVEVADIVFGKVLNSLRMVAVVQYLNSVQQRRSEATRLVKGKARKVLECGNVEVLPGHGSLFGFADGMGKEVRRICSLSLSGLADAQLSQLADVCLRHGLVLR